VAHDAPLSTIADANTNLIASIGSDSKTGHESNRQRIVIFFAMECGSNVVVSSIVGNGFNGVNRLAHLLSLLSSC
jgi:hypothetical protein